MHNKRLYFGAITVWVSTSLLFPLQAYTAEETTKRIPMEDVQRFSNAIGQIKNIMLNPSMIKNSLIMP
nr:hypothetical protein [Legionella tunisiensis]